MCGARGHRNVETRTSLSTTTMPRLACRVIVGKSDGKGSLGRPGYIDGKIILKLILRR